MARNKKVRKPVQLQLTAPPGDTEVSIGGERFTVTVKSAAGLDQVTAACERLYRSCVPKEARTSPMGFAGPGSGGPEISGPVGQSLFNMDLD